MFPFCKKNLKTWILCIHERHTLNAKTYHFPLTTSKNHEKRMVHLNEYFRESFHSAIHSSKSNVIFNNKKIFLCFCRCCCCRFPLFPFLLSLCQQNTLNIKRFTNNRLGNGQMRIEFKTEQWMDINETIRTKRVKKQKLKWKCSFFVCEYGWQMRLGTQTSNRYPLSVSEVIERIGKSVNSVWHQKSFENRPNDYRTGLGRH